MPNSNNIGVIQNFNNYHIDIKNLAGGQGVSNQEEQALSLERIMNQTSSNVSSNIIIPKN